MRRRLHTDLHCGAFGEGRLTRARLRLTHSADEQPLITRLRTSAVRSRLFERPGEFLLGLDGVAFLCPPQVDEEADDSLVVQRSAGSPDGRNVVAKSMASSFEIFASSL